MTEQTQPETFTLNGKEYRFDETSDRGKDIVGLMQELQHEELRVKREAEKLSVALKGFNEMLSEELQEKE